MSLLDTIDGAFMNFAYGWAFSRPVRKIFYNMTITWLSVVVALVIGTIELMSVFSEKLSLTGQPWDFVSGLDLNYVGYAIVGLFVLTWAVALAIWHFGRIEEKWQAGSIRANRCLRAWRSSGPESEQAAAMTVAPGTPPLQFTDIEAVMTALRTNGHRVTTPCRVVLEALFAAEGPVSAQFIADGQGDSRVSLDVASVYRNLERLEQLGVVRHVHLGHAPGLYMLIGDGEKEYLACDRCGRVTTVDPSELERIRNEIRKRFGYEARFSHFPIIGLCESCSGSDRASSEARHEHQHSHGDYIHSHAHGHSAAGLHAHDH